MERVLITQSLLSSWQYMYDCWSGSEDDAAEEFVKALNRIPKEPTPAMQNGIAFENEVYAAASGKVREPHDKWEHGIQKIAPLIKGAPVQIRLQRPMEIDGWNLLCYGVLDALQAGVITDVKFSSKSLGSVEAAGKYMDSAQHPMYFYICPEAYMFRYLLSDGEDLYVEQYRREESRDITEIIRQFLRSVDSMGLSDLYLEKWKAK